jgi:hypothetical protein
MAHPEVIKFISEQLAAGHSEADIRTALKAKNWPDSEIDMGFSAWRGNPTLPDRKDVGRFVGESWNIFRNLVPLIGRLYLAFLIKALYVLVPTIVIFILMRIMENTNREAMVGLSVLGIVATIVLIVFMIYYGIWLQATLVLMVRNRSVNAPAEQLMAEAKPFIGKFFGTSILMGILVFLWSLLLIIPGIIFGVYYTFAEYIVMDKNISGMDAIRLSKRYVEGLWWQVVFSLLGLAAVGILSYLAIQAIGLLGGEVGGQFVGGILGFLFQLAFMPYSVIYMYLLYERLKSLKPEIS